MTVTKRAYAKINLYLDVVGKRPDGYHDLISIMQKISLYDEIMITRSETLGIEITSDVEGLPLPPADNTNLIAKAAQVMFDNYNLSGSIAVKVNKRIPMGAGLGGGSSNAAEILKGIKDLYDLKISEDEITRLAQKLGADVPFCLTDSFHPHLAEGIGEKLSPLCNALPKCCIVLVCPCIHVSTAEIFGQLTAYQQDKENLLCKFIHSVQNKDLHKMAVSVYNIFTTVTVNKFPLVGQCLQLLSDLGAVGVNMSGTGSAVYGIFVDLPTAEAAREKLLSIAPYVYITQPFERKI